MDTIKEPRLDIRHQRIIQEIMVNNKKKEVLVVGAGDCKKVCQVRIQQRHDSVYAKHGSHSVGNYQTQKHGDIQLETHI